MKVSIENGELVIKIPVSEDPKPSKTGKTLVVASSYGNQVTEVEVNGKKVVIGLNAYIKA